MADVLNGKNPILRLPPRTMPAGAASPGQQSGNGDQAKLQEINAQAALCPVLCEPLSTWRVSMGVQHAVDQRVDVDSRPLGLGRLEGVHRGADGVRVEDRNRW